MKDRYVYPAVVSYDETDRVYNISFPDISNAFTFAETEEEIMQSAKEVLELCLYDLEEQGLEPPSPTNISKILEEKKGSVILVEVWMPMIRDRFENKSIKKTLTIPKWLNDIAEENNINFSQLLQAAIKNYLGMNKNVK